MQLWQNHQGRVPVPCRSRTVRISAGKTWAETTARKVGTTSDWTEMQGKRLRGQRAHDQACSEVWGTHEREVQ